ncbi:MAG: hypothetical protein JXB85_09770 [Anaerolineales bacterium]|nr:hypothetical protein [Anaerolineales bacterium]
MQRKNRTQLALGLLLILAAAWLIATRIYPDLDEMFNLVFDWPLWVVISGGLILLIGLLVGAPGMAVPACIVAGIGGILYYCNSSNDWAAWSYLWTLIPGFVGIGTILSGLLEGTFRQEIRHGLNLLVISAILFAIFATLMGGAAFLGDYSDYLPIGLLFLLGLWLIVRGIFRRDRPRQ